MEKPDSDNDDIWNMIIQKGDRVKRLVCKRCDHQWNYKGKDPYRASCPRCKTSVVLKSKKN